MLRYKIELYSGRIYTTYTLEDLRLKGETKYLEIVGFENSKHEAITFRDLENLDSLKGSKAILISNRVLIYKPASKVKRVWKEKI